PIAGLMAQLQVSLLAGFFFAFPFIFWQAWLFVTPGLYKKERKFLLPLCLSTWGCFLLGATFAYFVVFRFALGFLSTFGAEGVEQTWIVGEYLGFMIRFLLAFGLVFEEPVIILLLAKMGLVTSKVLSGFRSYAIVLSFVLAALITPPDWISQLCCGVPLVILYEVSILLVRLTEKKRALEEEA
ncbi:twin-arginine translocase subunit TatC, partial [bacterium]|nr:twin-arginine translocase subunit TatC [bacterium]